MNMITTIACQLLVSLCSLLAATIATFRPERLASLFSLFSKSGLRRIIQATVHWITLIAMLLGIAVPFVAFFASCIAFASSIPLVLRAVHLRILKMWLLPTLLVVASIVVAITQPLGLKVLALPKADVLPFVPVLSRVIKTYDEGLCFEGIATGEDGTLYLSGNRGLDFSRGDYYHDAQGELIERKSDGTELILFKTPRGLTQACLYWRMTTLFISPVTAISLISGILIPTEKPCNWHSLRKVRGPMDWILVLTACSIHQIVSLA
jgi:hypothetical protein